MARFKNIVIKERIDGIIQKFKYPADLRLLELVTAIKHRTGPKRKRDVVCATSGNPGIGKTNTVNTLGYAFDPTYSLHTHVLYDPQYKPARDFIYGRPPQNALNVDEAARVLYRRNAMTGLNRGLNVLFSICRKRRQVAIFSIPKFTWLDKDFRNDRILFWIYMIETNEPNIRHAVVSLADQREGKDTWNDGKLAKLANAMLPERPADSTWKDELEMLREYPNYWFEFDIYPLPKPIIDEYERLAEQNAPEFNMDTASGLYGLYREAAKRLLNELYKMRDEAEKRLYTQPILAKLTGFSIGTVNRLIQEAPQDVETSET